LHDQGISEGNVLEKLINKGGLTEKELHSKGQRRAELGGACFFLPKSFNGKRGFPKVQNRYSEKKHDWLPCLFEALRYEAPTAVL